MEEIKKLEEYMANNFMILSVKIILIMIIYCLLIFILLTILKKIDNNINFSTKQIKLYQDENTRYFTTTYWTWQINKYVIHNHIDNIYGNKIMNEGTQINTIYYDNQYINKLMSIHEVEYKDKAELNTILNKLADKNYSVKENNKLIDIISKYSGLLSDSFSIIEFLKNMMS